MLGCRLLSLHNLHCMSTVMAETRSAIARGEFGAYRADFLKDYQKLVPEECLQG